MGVCTHEDDFLREQAMKGQARWTARLSSGQLVYQDDNRPGEEPASAWVRLAEHLRNTGERIVSLWLQFRDHVERPLADDAAGYFFARVAGGVWPGDETYDFYLLGQLEYQLENGLTKASVMVQRWKVPELIFCEVTQRDPEDARAMGQGQFLIRQPCPSTTTETSSPPSEKSDVSETPAA